MPYIHIDLDDIETYELIQELERRYLDEKERIQLAEIIKSEFLYKEKLKFFLAAAEKYSMLELHEMFKERYDPIAIPKEQLALALPD